jgi:HPt (histidine-containing phosphotransfer) domain-containing protein
MIEHLASMAGPAGAAVVLAAMIDSAPRLLEGLDEALRARDAKEFRRHAHSLKTNALTVGADALASQFQGLEDMGAAGQFDDTAPEKTAAVASAYRRLIDDIRKLREHYQGASS